jgi:metal-dependent amidase/aminoacylase/carboxypeptidase family protein
MDAKSGARERFESARDGLIELSHRIHAHPELGFEEEKASSWLCESLTEGDSRLKREYVTCRRPLSPVLDRGL